MTIEYDITQDVRYQQGQEKGLEKGETKKAIVGIINMSNKGFDIAMIAEILEVAPNIVATILEQYKKKAAIVSLLSKPNADPESIAAKLQVSPILVELVKEDMKG